MAAPTEPTLVPIECEVCGEFFHANVAWFEEGHHSNCEVKGRHLHLTDWSICPDCKSGVKQTSKRMSVESSGLIWTAVHGNLLFALRHPGNKGPSRQLVRNFVENLGSILEEEGVLTPNQLRKTYRLEVEAGNEDFRHLVEPGGF